MSDDRIRDLLSQVHDGTVSIEDALEKLRVYPFQDLSFARVDSHRELRCGFPEVIYCGGKTPSEVAQISVAILETSDRLLATRADIEQLRAVEAEIPSAQFHERARCITVEPENGIEHSGRVLILSAGTSDAPVAEEARVTAEIMGSNVETVYDAGIAGIHRLLSKTESIRAANVIVVVAGMEGALASVVGGLAHVPVIAVPTSVGYGASFGGIAPLLTMINSCAAGVSVVNIDNGFGAGYLAAVINRQTREQPS
jgi:NCAIR mutase (PurE)-related protein